MKLETAIQPVPLIEPDEIRVATSSTSGARPPMAALVDNPAAHRGTLEKFCPLCEEIPLKIWFAFA